MRLVTYYIMATCFTLSVASCVTTSPAGPNVSPSPGVTITADCGWSAQVSAWLDSNGNGMREADEPPIPNVNFYFNNANTSNQYQRGPFVTNSKGETQLNEFMPGCPGRAFEIYPAMPAGYRLTTAPKQSSQRPG